MSFFYIFFVVLESVCFLSVVGSGTQSFVSNFLDVLHVFPTHGRLDETAPSAGVRCSLQASAACRLDSLARSRSAAGCCTTL